MKENSSACAVLIGGDFDSHWEAPCQACVSTSRIVVDLILACSPQKAPFMVLPHWFDPFLLELLATLGPRAVFGPLVFLHNTS